MWKVKVKERILNKVTDTQQIANKQKPIVTAQQSISYSVREKLKQFPSILEQDKYSTFSALFLYGIWSISKSSQGGEKNRVYLHWKGGCQNIHIQVTSSCTWKNLNTPSKNRKVAIYKINLQKPVAFVYANDKLIRKRNSNNNRHERSNT